MKARLLLKERLTVRENGFKELIVWGVTVSGKYPEGIRYRFVFIP